MQSFEGVSVKMQTWQMEELVETETPRQREGSVQITQSFTVLWLSLGLGVLR